MIYESNETPPHIQRMEDEQSQLQDRIEKLDKFIGGNPIFLTLDEGERNDMINQLVYMKQYNHYLTSRLFRAVRKYAAESGVDAQGSQEKQKTNPPGFTQESLDMEQDYLKGAGTKGYPSVFYNGDTKRDPDFCERINAPLRQEKPE